MSDYHKAVLLEESVSALISDPNGIYMDATFGAGGHSKAILSKISDKAQLISFDRDSDAQANIIKDPRFHLVHNNFRFIHNYLMLNYFQQHSSDNYELNSHIAEQAKADGILADLGVSSHQFDTADRGFSFRYDEAKLDMRMNTQAEFSAKDIINTYSQEQLTKIFKLYAEIDKAYKLADLIIKARENSEITTTKELCAAIEPMLPKFAEHKFLAKIYQALRIEVNQEMYALERLLEGAAASLKKGGRLVIISYHSLEDRMVKNFAKSGNIEGKLQQDIKGNIIRPFNSVNKKPILPSEEEISENTRARSAKLRILEKL